MGSVEVQAFLAQMIYTHVLNRGGLAVRGPLDQRLLEKRTLFSGAEAWPPMPELPELDVVQEGLNRRIFGQTSTSAGVTPLTNWLAACGAAPGRCSPPAPPAAAAAVLGNATRGAWEPGAVPTHPAFCLGGGLATA